MGPRQKAVSVSTSRVPWVQEGKPRFGTFQQRAPAYVLAGGGWLWGHSLGQQVGGGVLVLVWEDGCRAPSWTGHVWATSWNFQVDISRGMSVLLGGPGPEMRLGSQARDRMSSLQGGEWRCRPALRHSLQSQWEGPRGQKDAFQKLRCHCPLITACIFIKTDTSL